MTVVSKVRSCCKLSLPTSSCCLFIVYRFVWFSLALFPSFDISFSPLLLATIRSSCACALEWSPSLPVLLSPFINSHHVFLGGLSLLSSVCCSRVYYRCSNSTSNTSFLWSMFISLVFLHNLDTIILSCCQAEYETNVLILTFQYSTMLLLLVVHYGGCIYILKISLKCRPC
jgi:hypothetical protein